MINLLIDEGYYVDFLSILEVKLLKSDDKTRDSLSKQFLFYSNSLGEQIGDSKPTFHEGLPTHGCDLRVAFATVS